MQPSPPEGERDRQQHSRSPRYQRAIDQATYKEQGDKLREELALAELELLDARMEEFDLDGILGSRRGR